MGAGRRVVHKPRLHRRKVDERRAEGIPGAAVPPWRAAPRLLLSCPWSVAARARAGAGARPYTNPAGAVFSFGVRWSMLGVPGAGRPSLGGARVARRCGHGRAKLLLSRILPPLRLGRSLALPGRPWRLGCHAQAKLGRVLSRGETAPRGACSASRGHAQTSLSVAPEPAPLAGGASSSCGLAAIGPIGPIGPILPDPPPRRRPPPDPVPRHGRPRSAARHIGPLRGSRAQGMSAGTSRVPMAAREAGGPGRGPERPRGALGIGVPPARAPNGGGSSSRRVGLTTNAPPHGARGRGLRAEPRVGGGVQR